MTMRRFAMFLFCCLPLSAQAAMEVEHARLGHAVRAWYAAESSVPVVHVAISFEGAGSVSDPTALAGRAVLAAGMLNEGAGEYDSIAFQHALEDRAIQFEADASDDRLIVEIHCLREHAAEAGALLALALSQPHFAANDVARVKTQILAHQARLEESPDFKAAQAFEQAAFAGHPYANAHYGTPTSIAAITPADLQDYMKLYVTRGNMLIAAAGDVDSAVLKTMLKPLVDALPASEAGAVKVSAIDLQDAGSTVQVPMDVPQSTVMFAAPAVRRDDPRYYGLYLLNDILGGNGLTARLAEALRQKKGLVYGVSSWIDVRDGITLLRGSLASRADQAGAAQQAVKDTLDALRTRGVTTQECEDARTHVLGAFPLQLDGSRAVAGILLKMRIYGLGEDYMTQRAEKFAAVACNDLNVLAREFLDPSRFIFAVAGPTP